MKRKYLKFYRNYGKKLLFKKSPSFKKTTFQKKPPQASFQKIIRTQFFRNSATFCFASWRLHLLTEQRKSQDGHVCSRHDSSRTEDCHLHVRLPGRTQGPHSQLGPPQTRPCINSLRHAQPIYF